MKHDSHFVKLDAALADWVLPRLRGSAKGVLLYIIRRTVGFGRGSAAIPLRQFVDGMAVGSRQVDYGTGLSESSVQRGIKELENSGVILINRSQEPYSYSVASPESILESWENVVKITTPNHGRMWSKRTGECSQKEQENVVKKSKPAPVYPYIERKSRKKEWIDRTHPKKKKKFLKRKEEASLTSDVRVSLKIQTSPGGGGSGPQTFCKSGPTDVKGVSMEHQTNLSGQDQAVVRSRWKSLRGAKKLPPQDAARIFALLDKHSIPIEDFIAAIEGYGEHISGAPDVGEFVSGFWGWGTDSKKDGTESIPGDCGGAEAHEASKTHRESSGAETSLAVPCNIFSPVAKWEEIVAPLTVPWNPSRDDPKGRLVRLCRDQVFVDELENVCKKCAAIKHARNPEWLTFRWLISEKAGKDNWWKIHTGELDWMTKKEKMSAAEEFFSSLEE